MSEEIQKGLEGVLIGESRLGNIDGDNGNLWYCGYHIDELVENSSYEEVVFLLLNQRLPDEDELEEIEEQLSERRLIPTEVRGMISEIADSQPMDVLRTAVSMLAAFDDEPDNMEEARDKLVGIIAKIPTILAYQYRFREGKDPIEPAEELSHAENFLYMLHGDKPRDEEEDAMDAALILYAEHGMNASTFSGVVTVSTLASVYSAMTSAINTLQGPLHGGATETVMEMIDDVGSADKAEAWVEEKLANHEKIPGFGHRVYKALDPRCDHFRSHTGDVSFGDLDDRLATIESLREAVVDRLGGKGIWPNADLYSGTMYQALGIPSDFYTALFAMARSAGWSAHILEQLEDNRIFRPRIRYVGELDKLYIPLEER